MRVLGFCCTLFFLFTKCQNDNENKDNADNANAIEVALVFSKDSQAKYIVNPEESESTIGK